MQSKNTPVNDFQVAAARASKGFPKNQFFFFARDDSPVFTLFSARSSDSRLWASGVTKPPVYLDRSIVAECREFSGRGKVVLVRPAGAEVGTRLHGAIFGRICGTWASAGRSFAFVSHKRGPTVTMGRGWDEDLLRTSAVEVRCELGSASSCMSGLRSEVNSPPSAPPNATLSRSRGFPNGPRWA